jgi:ABC-type transporter Mla MlaB component
MFVIMLDDMLCRPFGHGETYCRWTLALLSDAHVTVAINGTTHVSVNVTRVANVDNELAAVDSAGFSLLAFVRATKQSAVRLPPVKQLFGFSKQNGLAVGASRTVLFELSPAARALVDEKGSRLLVPGTFEVAVGNLVVEVTVAGSSAAVEL